MRPERSEWVTALITLPRFYNPSPTGRRRRIEAEKLDQTIGEVGRQFGGCTLHEDPKVGVWFSRGIVYRDDVMLLEVDMPDSPESREWLIQYARESFSPVSRRRPFT